MTFVHDYTLINTDNYKKIFVAGDKIVFESFNDRQVFAFADEEMAKFIFEHMKDALKRADDFFDCDSPF